MSKFEKELARLRQNPKNVRYEVLEKILLKLGFSKRQSGTSHVVFRKAEIMLTVPVKKPFLKLIYVKKALEVIEKMIDLDEG